jgi:hypothetical protein
LLFTEAEKKYGAALDIKPDTPDVFHNWENLLRDWAKTKTGEQAHHLLAKAKEVASQRAGGEEPSQNG